MVGVLLGGIVAMQVSLLKLNSGISRAVETTTTLERQNADLEAAIARLSAPDRIESGASSLGMLMPPAGDVTYLSAGAQDPAKAVRRMQPPSEDAAALLANHGIVPGSIVAAAPAPVTPAAAATPATGDDCRSRRDARSRGDSGARRHRGAGRHAGARHGGAAHDDLPDPCQRRSRRRTGISVLIERRIGLLFAVFLGMLVLAGARAGWLGIVRANTLQSAAATQQKADIVVPARRGTISDANGIELAISKPAQTIAATPYLIDKPAEVAAQLSGILRRARGRAAAQARAARHRLRLPRPPRADQAGAARAEAAHRGARVHPRVQPRVPARLDGVAAARHVGSDGTGLSGLEYRLEDRIGGRDGERRLVRDALGDTIELREDQRTVPGQDVRLTLDANIQDHTEEVLAEVGELWQPKGATALVMDPRDGSILALANWPRVNANKLYEAPDYAMTNRATGATYEPGSTFKAFTVAAARRGRQGHALDSVHAAAGAPGRRPRDHRLACARLGDARRRGHPRGVLQRRRGDDRAQARSDALRPVGAALRLRQADGSRPAGRGGGDRADLRRLLGLDRRATWRWARASP